jgi:dTDP-4-amino-4,6-dideoxygalactose transaminase
MKSRVTRIIPKDVCIMQIKLVDLAANYLSIKDEIDEAISDVLENSAFIMGPAVREFEEKWASYCGVKRAIGVANGTEAVRLAIKALGIGPADEVITVANTFIATTEAISDCGATPVFVDIDEDTYTIDVSKIAAAITPKTKAIVCVHLYGHACDMATIMEIARRNDLIVIEDCAQCHGGRWRGEMLGTIGDVGCFSMFPAKILGAFGDAGAVITNDGVLADRIDLLRNHGRASKYESVIEGYNARLDALQAKILTVKLRHLDNWIARRRFLAKRYTEKLRGEVLPPVERDGVFHPFYMYVVRTSRREAVVTKLKSSGIACGIHYPVPLHLQPAYAHLGTGAGALPVTERTSTEILSLPLYPEMSEETQDIVIAAMRDV